VLRSLCCIRIKRHADKFFKSMVDRSAFCKLFVDVAAEFVNRAGHLCDPLKTTKRRTKLVRLCCC
jgi:ribosomal protein L17